MHKQEKHTDEPDQRVEAAMALLDLEAPVPENLAASIMASIEELDLPKVRRLNFTSYIQIAAAILFGVFIGHKFGKIVNTQTPEARQDPIAQYFKAHHFNIDNTEINSTSFFINTPHE